MIVFTIIGLIVAGLASAAGMLFAGALAWDWIARHYAIQRDLLLAYRDVQRKRRGEKPHYPA